MKNSIMIIAFLLIGSVAMAQTPDTTTYEYCEVVSISKNMASITKSDANIFIDFGEGVIFTPKDPLKDDNGKDLKFLSSVDCLNYLATKGWKLGQTNIFYQQGGMAQRTVTRYTLSRPKYVVRNQ